MGIMDQMQKEYSLGVGKITPLIRLDDYIIRYIESSSSLEDEEDSDLSGYSAQGRITNVAKTTIDNLVMDVSYYDVEGKFLGLNKTGNLFYIDELDPDSTIPFEIDLDIPEQTDRCVLNISARELKGFWARFIMGSKG